MTTYRPSPFGFMNWQHREPVWQMSDLDLFLAKLADCFLPTQEPYRRIVLGREGVDRVRPVVYWGPLRGVIHRFEVPDCELCCELVEMGPITLANRGDAAFFEPAQTIVGSDGHEWICGEVT